MKHQLSVPDMSCNHCKMSIENALKNFPEISNIEVNLNSKNVNFDLTDEQKLPQVVQEIEDLGYDVNPA